MGRGQETHTHTQAQMTHQKRSVVSVVAEHVEEAPAEDVSRERNFAAPVDCWVLPEAQAKCKW